jgi:hypothetical protein
LLHKLPVPTGKLHRRLGAVRMNFFAAVSSALGILPRQDHEVPRGRIPRCANAARLDGSIDPEARSRRCDSGYSVHTLRVSAFSTSQLPATFPGCGGAVGARWVRNLLVSINVDPCMVCHDLAHSRGEATSQLGREVDVSVSVGERAEVGPTSDAQPCRSIATVINDDTPRGLSCRRNKRTRLPSSAPERLEYHSAVHTW